MCSARAALFFPTDLPASSTSVDGVLTALKAFGCTLPTGLQASTEPTTGRRTSRSSTSRYVLITEVGSLFSRSSDSQRQRWYPSAMVMSNGSVLVVGGETGSNGPPEASLEILPPVNDLNNTWIFLDYLNRTDPNNLYPFLSVMPSGNIFIGQFCPGFDTCTCSQTGFTGYYNEARLLDPVTFDTVKVLPNIPGSVNSPLAGRTYPMEGTAVLLPQFAPYTDPVTMLVCGGSNFGVALDNCVSIQPEVENPTWTLERMVSAIPCSLSCSLISGSSMFSAAFEACHDLHSK